MFFQIAKQWILFLKNQFDFVFFIIIFMKRLQFYHAYHIIILLPMHFENENAKTNLYVFDIYSVTQIHKINRCKCMLMCAILKYCLCVTVSKPNAQNQIKAFFFSFVFIFCSCHHYRCKKKQHTGK